MQISELAATTGHTVATVKFYLRTGLLPPGERTSATRATYDADHVQRLRLIRALIDVGGLSLAQVQQVLEVLGGEDRSPTEVLGAAYFALAGRAPTESDGRVRKVLVELGWAPLSHDPYLARLEEVVIALDDLGVPISDDALRTYARAAMDVATVDIDRADISSNQMTNLSKGLTTMAAGTILYEPILTGLRRLAHAEITISRYGRPTPADDERAHDKMGE
ncbi:putative MerR family transcriptional regulator [Gordonia effusa NBRC 100432]|uniref:Putative MerR family transcriptional regulator n=1 Tax=Gordonia effusa NBRC 100432 TaxID=1077974 RepID=H0R581_9ACTN|nr:MerR family transcriptional regulator [Gordonia effusa]GAB20232.1 putative MerR family transcriptional regulator [Gordonia effusa NBRC 100432]